MNSNPHTLLLKLSAVVGLTAGAGVLAAGVMQERPAGGAVVQPEVSPVQQAMQGATQAMQAQDWPKAIKGFERVLELDPNNSMASFRLAYCVHASGDMERAIPLHEAAAKFPQARPVALYNLGCAHAVLGHTDKAFEALKTAIEAGFNGAGSPEGLAGAYSDPDLASIRDDARFAKLFGTAPGAKDKVSDAKLAHFWVGKWDCYSATTKAKAGTNELTLRNKGSVILEHWEASGGTSGESWNWFNPAEGVWKQVWLDASGSVTEFVGTRQGDGIMYEGTTSDAPGVIQRMHVRPIENGRVRQTGTSSKDEGKTWTPAYDLIYVPRGQAFDGEI